MGRFLGGRIGNFIQKQSQGFAEDGIHTLSDQFYQISLNGWKEGVNAVGGDSIVNAASGYKYHIFKNPGTFTLNSSEPQVVDVLIVAGGGRGGNNQGGGGGGGGGVKFLPQHSISPGPYSIVVGGGAPAATTTNADQNSSTYGGNSSGFGWTCGGGAPGGQSHALFDSGQNAPNPGAPNYVRGCGGGGTGRNNVAGGSGLTSGGYACPNFDPPSDIDAGGGGGGAGGNGQNSPDGSGSGNGGAGHPSGITGSTVIYAGGGGGGSQPNSNPYPGGAGGPGGGGAGAGTGQTDGVDGTDGLGGGGGGAQANGTAGTGGSGVVIVRYEIGETQYTA